MKITTLEDTPKMLHVGTLYVKGEAVYIVEVLEEYQGMDGQYVTVYEVEKGSKPPIKAYKRIQKRVGYKPTTALGALASSMFGTKEKIYKEENPPLFLTDIVYGKDTFTGKEGRGFYERAKDTVKLTTKETKVIYGEPTGVFIGLDSIKWEKLVIAPSDILLEYNARKMLWHL